MIKKRGQEIKHVFLVLRIHSSEVKLYSRMIIIITYKYVYTLPNAVGYKVDIHLTESLLILLSMYLSEYCYKRFKKYCIMLDDFLMFLPGLWC